MKKIYRLTCFFSSLFSPAIALAAPVPAAAPFANNDPVQVYSENNAYRTVARPWRFNHQLHLGFNPSSGGSKSIAYRLAYSLGMDELDVGAQYLSTTWGGISPTPSVTDYATAPLNGAGVERLPSEPWSLLLYEIGYRVRGRLFPFQSKAWFQYGRVSLAYASAKERASGVSLHPVFYGAEAGLGYQISNQIFIAPTVSYRFGMAQHIPLSLLQAGLSLNYYPD